MTLFFRQPFLILCLVSSFFLLCPTEAQEVAPEPSGEHKPLGLRIADELSEHGVSRPAAVLIISTLPIVELRGAVPVGHVLWDVPSLPTTRERVRTSMLIYLLAVAGNMIPVPLILWFLGPLSNLLRRCGPGRALVDWLFARTRRKGAGIEKYETLGLALFVAIPLPVTGAWTGAMLAFLMGIRFHHAMWSILLGVMVAGMIMTVLSLLGWIGAVIAGVVLLLLAATALLGMFKREA